MDASWRTGKINAVPCPWCGQRNNFEDDREILLDQWSGQGAAGDNPWFACDHCRRPIEVVKAEPTVLVSVRRTNKGNRLG